MDKNRIDATSNLIIEILTGPEQGERFTVYNFPCVIGRGETCHVILKDPDHPPGVSRQHATITVDAGVYMLTDHSTNGTHIGSRLLVRDQSASLSFPVEIQFGPTVRLRLFTGDTAPLLTKIFPSSIKPAISMVSPASANSSLKSRMTDIKTLQYAWERVNLNHGAAGPDRVTVIEFARHSGRRLIELQHLLRKGNYDPMPPRIVAIPKPNGDVRMISILNIQDRIVQHALNQVLSPLIVPQLGNSAYGYRMGGGVQQALQAIDAGLSRGYSWIAETDIEQFFDTISHRQLIERLSAITQDPFILTLVSRCLAIYGITPGIGIPQGAATSPLFSNLYLADFDKQMEADGRWLPVRYGDDMVYLCHNRNMAQTALLQIEGYLASQLYLKLKPEKTRIVPLSAGFTFLGFHFSKDGRRPGVDAVASLNNRINSATPAEEESLLRGWQNYYGDISEIDLQDSVAENSEIVQNVDTEKTDERSDDNLIDYNQVAEKMLDIFSGRKDAYATHHLRNHRLHVLPHNGPLTIAILQDHFYGRQTCAVYPLLIDSTVRFVVIDIDIEKEKNGDSKMFDIARRFAIKIIAAGEACGLELYCEESGQKGYHVWIFFADAIVAETGQKLARLLIAASGINRAGLVVEVFPRHSEWPGPELGDAVKIPYGVHKITGKRTYFIGDDGQPVPDPADWLDTVVKMPLTTVKKAIKKLTASAKAEKISDDEDDDVIDVDTSKEVSTIINKCQVLRDLSKMARKDGKLRHTHRLILLYTFGRLGDPGAKMLHSVLACCENYSFQRTQVYLDKLETGKMPLTCRRIREWLEENETDKKFCDCDDSRHTPLDCLKKYSETETVTPKRRTPPTRIEPDVHDIEEWDEIRNAMFIDDEKDE